jgi:hypothetical protein
MVEDTRALVNLSESDSVKPWQAADFVAESGR